RRRRCGAAIGLYRDRAARPDLQERLGVKPRGLPRAQARGVRARVSARRRHTPNAKTMPTSSAAPALPSAGVGVVGGVAAGTTLAVLAAAAVAVPPGSLIVTLTAYCPGAA